MLEPWTLRPLTEADHDLLRTATLTNVNWTGAQRFTIADVDTRPDFGHYLHLCPERGDFGLVAEREAAAAPGMAVIGVTWLLFLSSADPGYGFVADGVPELSITVWPGHRG